MNGRWRREGENEGEKEERIVVRENQGRKMEEMHGNRSGHPTAMPCTTQSPFPAPQDHMQGAFSLRVQAPHPGGLHGGGICLT